MQPDKMGGELLAGTAVRSSKDQEYTTAAVLTERDGLPVETR